MGYTRIAQFADTVIVYKYEKDYIERRKKIQSSVQKKRARERRKLQNRTRSKRSIYRSRKNFFRLCHHNNHIAKSITFCTLTFAYDIEYKAGCRAVSEFFRRINKKIETEIPISYISVPETTKKGRLHFHLLIYNLPSSEVTREPNTRNFQRQWQRGYLDMRLADTVTEGLAGYMAKYMAKSFQNFKTQGFRGYSASRSIEKPTNEGSNTLHHYMDMILDTYTHLPVQNVVYNTQYMGQCFMTTYKKITK